MGVQVDKTALSSQTIVPTGLQVRDLHGIAYGLDVAGRVSRLGTEDSGDAAPQQMTNCKRWKFMYSLRKMTRPRDGSFLSHFPL